MKPKIRLFMLTIYSVSLHEYFLIPCHQKQNLGIPLLYFQLVLGGLKAMLRARLQWILGGILTKLKFVVCKSSQVPNTIYNIQRNGLSPLPRNSYKMHDWEYSFQKGPILIYKLLQRLYTAYHTVYDYSFVDYFHTRPCKISCTYDCHL